MYSNGTMVKKREGIIDFLDFVYALNGSNLEDLASYYYFLFNKCYVCINETEERISIYFYIYFG